MVKAGAEHNRQTGGAYMCLLQVRLAKERHTLAPECGPCFVRELLGNLAQASRHFFCGSIWGKAMSLGAIISHRITPSAVPPMSGASHDLRASTRPNITARGRGDLQVAGAVLTLQLGMWMEQSEWIGHPCLCHHILESAIGATSRSAGDDCPK